MIHSVYADGMIESRKAIAFEPLPTPVNDWEDLNFLLDNTDHTFLFILTKEQVHAKELMAKYKYEDYLVHKSPQLTNCNYPDSGRRLTIYVLKGKGAAYEL